MQCFLDMYISYELFLHLLLGLDKKKKISKNVFNVGPLIFARVYFSSCIPAVNLQRRFHLSGERILRRLSSKFYTSNRHSRLLIHTFGD